MKIALSAFAVSVLWIALGSGVLLYYEYKQAQENILKVNMETGKTHSESISKSIWEYNTVLIQTQLKALVQLPSISYSRVTEANGAIWEFGTKSATNSPDLTFTLAYNDRGKKILLGVLETKVSYKLSPFG